MKRLDETKWSETLHETRDVLGRDRDEIRDAQVRDRDGTETLGTLVETRPRRDVGTSRDRLETETSRPRPHDPHPWRAAVVCFTVNEVEVDAACGEIKSQDSFW